jgi:hypothetical protein
MNALHSAVLQRSSEGIELGPFRTELQSSPIQAVGSRAMRMTGLRSADVRVSNSSLEQYLNACNPVCSG